MMVVRPRSVSNAVIFIRERNSWLTRRWREKEREMMVVRPRSVSNAVIFRGVQAVITGGYLQ
jgi:hypothetical protein